MIKWFIGTLLALRQKLRNCYYRHRFWECGENVLVYGKPRIVYGNRIRIGDNVNTNDGVLLNATGSSITIGDNVTISPDVHIMAGSYDPNEFVLHGDRTHIDRGGTYHQLCLD